MFSTGNFARNSAITSRAKQSKKRIDMLYIIIRHNRIRSLYTDDKQKMTNQLYSHIALALKKRKESQSLVNFLPPP